jgi:hypothetical protein
VGELVSDDGQQARRGGELIGCSRFARPLAHPKHIGRVDHRFVHQTVKVDHILVYRHVAAQQGKALWGSEALAGYLVWKELQRREDDSCLSYPIDAQPIGEPT